MPDFIVGQGEAAGVIYIVFGVAERFMANIDLAALGSAGIILEGRGGYSLGTAIANVGDVNGSGAVDLAITEFDRVYLLFGEGPAGTGWGAGTVNLATLNGTNGGAILTGPTDARSVAAAGDVDGDEIDDIVIGMPFVDAEGVNLSGRAAVVFGRTAFANLDLSGPAAFGGYAVNGSAAFDRIGNSVAGGGDVNGDGRDDVVVGASRVSTRGQDSGAVYVVYGRDGGIGYPEEITSEDFDGVLGSIVKGRNSKNMLGYSVSIVGDMNEDGCDEILVGTNMNGAYVLYGRPAGFGTGLVLSPNPTVDLWLSTTSPQQVVSGAGDVDGDGLADVIVGQPFSTVGQLAQAGRSHILFGSDLSRTGTLNLQSSEGVAAFRIDGAATSDQSSFAAISPGDLDGDGRDDLLIGARQADPFGRTNAGSAYLIYGPGGE